jgi:hypothetical protein
MTELVFCIVCRVLREASKINSDEPGGRGRIGYSFDFLTQKPVSRQVTKSFSFSNYQLKEKRNFLYSTWYFLFYL